MRAMDRLHVFLGTKAQYIKTAPLLRAMDDAGVSYRLIDSGQHARLSAAMRNDLGIRAPDHALGGAEDVTSIAGAVRWAATIALRLWSRRRVSAEVFGGDGGICVVHGDTPSTLLATLLARRAGLSVAHLEAGLRSHRLWSPFPEEAIRLVVMRLSDVLFAPDAVAAANLSAMGLADRTVTLSGNTVVEALRHAAGDVPPGSGPAVVTMHRVENLTSRRRVEGFVRIACRLAASRPVRFVVHGPTRQALARSGLGARLHAAGVETTPLLSHKEFVSLLVGAPVVVTDGGSIQEECALLGVPTLLWRDRTERPDGLGANVVLSRYDPAVVDAFLAEPERWRRAAADGEVSPSAEILHELGARLRGRAPPRRTRARRGRP